MKAVLVIDMPSDCTHCDLCRPIAFEGNMCGATGEPTYSGRCPLKPMPEEEMADAIPISFLKDKIALNESWGCYGYAKGLQSAIDEWEKQNETTD